ncbi:MAG: 3'-5' exonuclease domain-containing protein 2 [Alistipes sp.]|nr:3'-5' exonuclease domain-containing protein 2 [Alistipes sp.]
MAFVASISNDEVAALEAVHFVGRIKVVETPDALAEACHILSKESLIGFDTETRPSFQAGVSHKVSLLQLSTKEQCFLIRLNKLPLTREIIKILSSEKVAKVGADVRNDIAALNKLRHFTPRGFIDLQTEVVKYGIEDKSLRKISGIVLGKRVSKAQRLSNWAAKQLTPQQQMYAATDAWVCIEIYNKLTE